MAATLTTSDAKYVEGVAKGRQLSERPEHHLHVFGVLNRTRPALPLPVSLESKTSC